MSCIVLQVSCQSCSSENTFPCPSRDRDMPESQQNGMWTSHHLLTHLEVFQICDVQQDASFWFLCSDSPFIDDRSNDLGKCRCRDLHMFSLCESIENGWPWWLHGFPSMWISTRLKSFLLKVKWKIRRSFACSTGIPKYLRRVSAGHYIKEWHVQKTFKEKSTSGPAGPLCRYQRWISQHTRKKMRLGKVAKTKKEVAKLTSVINWDIKNIVIDWLMRDTEPL